MLQAIEGYIRCPGCKRKICDGCGIYKQLDTNKQVPIQFPEDFISEKQSGLGISIDLGTTTIAGMLWNLESGALLAIETACNPQGVIGADIISRIRFALKDECTARSYLQKLLVDELEKMTSKMVSDTHIQEAMIQKVVIVGNTAMCELLMGIRPTGIATAPFRTDYSQTCMLQGEKLGFRTLKHAVITVPPPIGGYVGADALAVYHAVMKKQAEETVLVMDIGTNGELMLLKNGHCYACSVAAGPALEGGAVSYGMRAAAGAIEQVVLQGSFPVQDILCRTVNQAIPKGICGSGLMDAVAMLCKLEIVDSTGYLCDSKEALQKKVPHRICSRLETVLPEGENRILLTDKEHPVYLTAGDIRQLQPAIAAMRAGIHILLEKAQVKMEQIERLYIAGAFGSYIQIESGMILGLFPKLAKEKIIQAGNLASTGAAMVLLSPVEYELMEKEAGEIQHIELADEEHFSDLFMEYMNFPEDIVNLTS